MFKTQCRPTHLFLEEHFSEYHAWGWCEIDTLDCQSFPIKLLDLKKEKENHFKFCDNKHH